MLRICIPVHNEATTIGVLLWRLRSVFQGFSREYDVVVYDDASSDGTGEVLEPYRSVMPLTVIRGDVHRGYAASIDALVRHVAADDEYARRDAMVLLQGDFTESPEHLPELVKRFEGGADLVAVHRTISNATPAEERRLRRWGRWAIAPFLRLPAVADPFTGFRLVRISVLRELLRGLGSRPVCSGEGWAANIDFALNVAPFARRIENVEFAPRYDVRQRASRRRGWTDVVALFHWARVARRATRPVPGGKAAAEAPGRVERAAEASIVPFSTERSNKTAGRQDRDSNQRPTRPERDRSGRAARGGDSSDSRGGEQPSRDGRGARDQRPPRGEQVERAASPPRGERAGREETRQVREDRPPKTPRPARPPRQERADRTESISAANESGDLAAAEAAEVPMAAEVGAPLGAAPTGERKSRRRRRRSRRERGERVPGEGQGQEPNSADAQHRAPGTPEPDGGDDGDDGDGGEGGDSAETSADVSTEAGGDASSRKRRSRRRRRGRRPGGPTGPGTAGTPDPSPPSAEPPAA